MEPVKRENTANDLEQELVLSARQKNTARLVRLRNLCITLTAFIAIWQLGAWYYSSKLLLPGPLLTAEALKEALGDADVWQNLLITMRRVLAGFSIAIILGLPLGFLMGFSRSAMQIMEPVINSVRQVPIMAWVPLTIVWFGLGDGPTVFLIAFSGLFPVLLSTISGVQSISHDYYNAARSMGASRWTILRRIIIPGSLPDVLTGMRLALSAGWMSVI